MICLGIFIGFFIIDKITYYFGLFFGMTIITAAVLIIRYKIRHKLEYKVRRIHKKQPNDIKNQESYLGVLGSDIKGQVCIGNE
jgi:hypothetical protein